MFLPLDVARCAGHSLRDEEFCDRRETCARYTALMRHDKTAGIEHYRGIAVAALACRDGQYTYRIPDSRD